jgi:hypothetical protein
MEQPHLTNINSEIIILLVSGTCCVPQLAIADQQAKQIIQQALQETGVSAQVKTLTISSALTGGIPMEIIKSIGIKADPSNIMRLPAIFINNRFISLGVPQLDVIKHVLTNAKKEAGNEK